MQQQQQQQQQRGVMNAAQEISKRFQAALEKHQFPMDKISPLWFESAMTALEFASPLSLGISGKEFAALIDIEHTGKINMLEFASLSNNLEARTFRELFITKDQYKKLMIEANELSALWNELTNPLRKKVEADYTAELQARAATEKGGKPASMKPIKAEA